MPSSIIAFRPEIFEQQLSRVSAVLAAVPPEEVDERIDWALQVMLEALGVERSSIAELSADGLRLEVTHSVTVRGAPLFPRGDLNPLLPWYTAKIRQGKPFHFDAFPRDLPRAATKEREFTKVTGIRSQVTVPFFVGSRVIGAIGFGSFRRQIQWSPRMLRSVKLLGEVFANAVHRKHVARELLKLREQLAHSSRVHSMGEVVASIAHEVNQPLFAIVSNARAAELLLSRKEPDLAEIGAALEDIVGDANRASAIITRIRSFLQRKPAELVPLEVNAVVETVQGLLAPELTRRHVTLSTSLAPALPPVLGDAVQLQQVLLNLLMNGAEAMETVPPAERRLEVSSALDGQGRVLLEVTDRGPGLDPQTRLRIFEPFYTTKPAGLGMGLAICLSIVESFGGRIEALPRAKRGTTLRVALPAQPT